MALRAMTVCVFLLISSFSIVTSYAQTDCGVVDGIGFPVDTGQFALAQDFSVASQRHQGRYHTGQDWHAGRDNSASQPVQAAARGRVTYSSVNGWGRDGGVVIIEHTFPGGDVYYTLYGHMAESGTVQFPPRLACVIQGEVIGVVADARPAPHLHFEVRVSGGTNGSVPGAGYSLEAPYDTGLRHPAKFILNQQTWLSLWHDWHLTAGAESQLEERGPIAPPVTLSDNSLLYLDGAGRTLRRATNDGRVLWRIRLDSDAVAVRAWRGSSLLFLEDGMIAVIDVEAGALGESWQVNAQWTGAPLELGDDLLFPSVDDTLLRLRSDLREISATYTDVPPFERSHVLPGGRFVILTRANEFRYYLADGTVMATAQLRESASFATSWDGNLLVYSRGGLWQVDRGGTWSLYIEDAPAGGRRSALLTTQERLYLFNGNRLQAYDRDFNQLWTATTPPAFGLAELNQYGNIIVITTNQGDILLVNDQGGFCNQVRIFGTDSSRQWQALGDDNLLRLAIADQILAIDWETFIRPCNV